MLQRGECLRGRKRRDTGTGIDLGKDRKGDRVVESIGPSEPMQNDQTCFFSNIFLNFYNIIKIII